MGYVDEVLVKVKEKNASEPEFLQAVEEVLESLRPLLMQMRNCTEKMQFLRESQNQTVRSCSVYLG